MHTTDLGGHSGCKILLCEEDNDRIFVRKISSTKEYNLRLQAQEKKQVQFTSNYLKTPYIFGSGYTNEGLYYFDMEYIQGITMAKYMQTIEIWKIRRLVELLFHSILDSKNHARGVDEWSFHRKINALKKSIDNCDDIGLEEAFEVLDTHQWSRFIQTQSHGDLTLENIIIKDGQVYLIDFLDSFYDCWIMDVSTLMQDVQIMWSFRYEQDINVNTLIRLKVFRDILMDEIKAVSKDDELEVYYALLLKIIRAYPYANDDITKAFIINKANAIVEYIKEK